MLTISMKTFMDHLKSAESKTKLKRPADINHLIDVLDAGKAVGNERWLNLDLLERVQAIIWQVGVREDPWNTAKPRYAGALGYLVTSLFAHDGSRGPTLTAADALLLGDYKMNWSPWQLLQDTYFLHKSSVTTQQLRDSGGFSTRFASEVCIPAGGLVGDWPQGNKFIFTMKARFDENNKVIIDSGGKLKTFGFGDTFLIHQPVNTLYMSDRAVSTDNNDKGGQVAFAGDIPLSRIIAYSGKNPVTPAPW